jgi:hypothetical protein
MKPHNCAFVGLFYVIGALIASVSSIFAFVTWERTGFALEPKFSLESSGREAALGLILSLVIAFYFMTRAGIMFHHSQTGGDNETSRSERTERDITSKP